MVYLISYEIADKTRDLSELHNAIKSYRTWWHHIENVWLIETEDGAQNIYSKLYKYLYKKDNLFIINIGSDHSGWLPKSAWDWLHNRIISVR